MILCNKGHSGHRLQSRGPTWMIIHSWAGSRLLARRDGSWVLASISTTGNINRSYGTDKQRLYQQLTVRLREDYFSEKCQETCHKNTTVRSELCTAVGRGSGWRDSRKYFNRIIMFNLWAPALISQWYCICCGNWQLFAHFMRIHKSSFNRIYQSKYEVNKYFLEVLSTLHLTNKSFLQ